MLHKLIDDVQPHLMVVDPITNFVKAGTEGETESMLMRLIDHLKARQITAVFTSLTQGGGTLERSQVGISSLIDTWLLLRDIEVGGERNRGMYVLKSRGMAHSNQIREFLLTDHGVELKDVYVGPEGVLTGSLRLAQEAREQAAALGRQQTIERRRRELERKRLALDAEIAAQREQFQAEEEELRLLIAEEEAAAERVREARTEMGRSRRADAPSETPSEAPSEPPRDRSRAKPRSRVTT
jgi:circadian clock protein KaiC